MKRVFLAGFVGGVLLFSWGSLSHMAIGLGNTGVQQLPQEQPVLAALQANIPKAGFYFFPGMGAPPAANATPKQRTAAMKAFEQKYERGPYGILIYHPDGTNPRSPRQLLIEFVLDLVEVMILAIVVSQAKELTGFHTRVGLVVLVGILAAITTNVEYWNWYGFPADYTFGFMFDKVVGFLIAGIAIAAVLKKTTAQPKPAEEKSLKPA